MSIPTTQHNSWEKHFLGMEMKEEKESFLWYNPCCSMVSTWHNFGSILAASQEELGLIIWSWRSTTFELPPHCFFYCANPQSSSLDPPAFCLSYWSFQTDTSDQHSCQADLTLPYLPTPSPPGALTQPCLVFYLHWFPQLRLRSSLRAIATGQMLVVF